MPRSMSSLRMVLLESCRPVVLGKISSDRLAGAPCGAKVRPLTGEFWASWRIMRSHEASKLWSWGESYCMQPSRSERICRAVSVFFPRAFPREPELDNRNLTPRCLPRKPPGAIARRRDAPAG